MATYQPRTFPSSGFEVISLGQKLEEERLPYYIRDEYYPMQIGEVVHDRYQFVAKLGLLYERNCMAVSQSSVSL
jgi:hypothetical protein